MNVAFVSNRILFMMGSAHHHCFVYAKIGQKERERW